VNCLEEITKKIEDMAEDKNGFLLYKDLIHSVKKLPKDKAGELFMHILSYVNDENPETDDLLIELSFEPIKQALKRDLKKYEKTKEKNRENANKRWQKNTDKSDGIPNDATACDRMPNDANVCKAMPLDAKHADIDSGSDTDTDSGSDILLEKETKEENIIKENFDSGLFEETPIRDLVEEAKRVIADQEEQERKKVAQKKERFKPPNLQDVQDYCNERQNGIEAYKFVNFYQSKGWKVGNQPMKDWKAAIHTWESKNKQNGKSNNQTGSSGNNPRTEQATFNITEAIQRTTENFAKGNIPGVY
jgi:hypothetical protein